MSRLEGSAGSQTASAGAASVGHIGQSPALSAPREPATRPAPAYLSVKAMCERLDVSESTFHRMRDEAWMPRPIALSPKVVRWSAAEVDEALRHRAPRVELGANPVPENLLPAATGRKYRSGAPA